MSEQYYVLTKLGECCRSLNSIITEMPVKRRSIEKYRDKNNLEKARDLYTELRVLQKKLIDNIVKVKLLLLETGSDDLALYAGKLFNAVKVFNLMTNDYIKFTGAVNTLIQQLPMPETTNASIIGRLMGNVKCGYYPTDLEHIAKIQSAVAFPKARINLFDPCCGCGLALEKLANGQNAATYGIEIDEYRTEEAQERLDRVGFGSYFHSRISHEAFHLMLLNPPYLSVMNANGGNSRYEKSFLVDSMYHLMYGGLLLYIIPYYRLTADICRVLCDNFTDLRIYRFHDKEFAKFKQIVVFGVRRKRIDGSDDVDTLLQYSLNPDMIPFLESVPEGLYTLPDTEKKVDIFKGAKFNVKELAEQLKSSRSIERLFEKSRLDSMKKKPLLPLNIGQVGLIGGSGLINGLVDCETPHIIKGQIIKEIKEDKNFVYDEKGKFTGGEIKATRVNRMIFNILTPDGFRSLT